MTLAFISFQQNDNKKMLFYQLLCSLIFTLHFIILGAVTGAAMNLLSVARSMVFFYRYRSSWANHRVWPFVFVIIYIVSGLLTFHNIYSIFPIVATVLYTIGLYVKTPKHSRLVILAASPCWMIYNVATMSIAGIITEAFVLFSLITSIVRLDMRKKS